MHEVTKILASTLDVFDLNSKFLDYSIRMSKADGGALLFLENSGKLSLAENVGVFSRDYWISSAFITASKWVATHGEPLVLEPYEQVLPNGLLPIPSEFQSCIFFPLKTPSRTIGVLNLARLSGREAFLNVDLEIVNVLASQASISIENVRLYHNIRDNYLKTIRAFALAVEAKDEYTHGHSEKCDEVYRSIGKAFRAS